MVKMTFKDYILSLDLAAMLFEGAEWHVYVQFW